MIPTVTLLNETGVLGGNTMDKDMSIRVNPATKSEQYQFCVLGRGKGYESTTATKTSAFSCECTTKFPWRLTMMDKEINVSCVKGGDARAGC